MAVERKEKNNYQVYLESNSQKQLLAFYLLSKKIFLLFS